MPPKGITLRLQYNPAIWGLQAIAQFSQCMAIWGYFEQFWSPPMATSERKKGWVSPA